MIIFIILHHLEQKFIAKRNDFEIKKKFNRNRLTSQILLNILENTKSEISNYSPESSGQPVSIM